MVSFGPAIIITPREAARNVWISKARCRGLSDEAGVCPGMGIHFISNQFIFCWWKGLYLILFRSFNNTYIRGKIRAKSWKFQSLWPTPVIMNSRLNPTNHSVREQQFKLSENILYGLVIMQYAVIKNYMVKIFWTPKKRLANCSVFSILPLWKV